MPLVNDMVYLLLVFAIMYAMLYNDEKVLVGKRFPRRKFQSYCVSVVSPNELLYKESSCRYTLMNAYVTSF